MTKAGADKFKAPCPFCNSKSKVLSIDDGKGLFHCFKGCPDGKGDAFTWVMKTTNASTFPEAVRDLGERCGVLENSSGYKPAQPAPIVATYDPAENERERAENIAFARMIWQPRVPIAGTLAEVYLNRRGIYADRLPGGAWPVTLGFIPRLKWTDRDPDTGKIIRVAYAPGLVAYVSAADRGFTGVHRTYLAQDGTRKAGFVSADGEKADKKMAGVCLGGAVRLGPFFTEGHIAEGLETSLTVMQAIGEPVWAALSLDGMGQIDFPECVKAITKWTDNDESDRAYARARISNGNERHLKLGIAVRECQAPDGHDWNSLHMEHLKQQKVHA